MPPAAPYTIPRPGRVALYAHIPFCIKKCPYCSFYSHQLKDPSLTRTVADSILREARGYRERRPWSSMTALSLYLGGGTPSLLPPPVMRDLLLGLRDIFPFEEDAEVTVEMNPGTLEDERIRAWIEGGVTRVSFGVQSLGPRTLKRLGRNHSADEARATMRALRAAGAFEISADLIYAVEAKNAREEWEETAREVAGWGADHVSAYALIVEEGTPFATMQARGKRVRLSDDEEFEQAEYLREQLAPQGYRQYEVSNWAFPGRESRHNSAYWDGGSYLSFGPSAHGFDATSRRRYWNLADTLGWIRAVRERGQGVAGDERVTARQHLEERLMLALRVVDGMPESDLAALAAEADLRWPPPGLALMEERGLVQRTGGRLRSTTAGLYLGEEIAARLAAGLERSQVREDRATGD